MSTFPRVDAQSALQPALEPPRSELSLLDLAASYAQEYGLRRLTAARLSKVTGVETDRVRSIFPTRTALINAVRNHHVGPAHRSELATTLGEIESKSINGKLGTMAREAECSHGAQCIIVKEMTLTDILHDPLIAMMNSADSVNWRSYVQLIQSAARVHARSTAGKA